MQIYRVCMHAIIKERYFFPKKWNVFLGAGMGYWVLDMGYRVLNCPLET